MLHSFHFPKIDPAQKSIERINHKANQRKRIPILPFFQILILAWRNARSDPPPPPEGHGVLDPPSKFYAFQMPSKFPARLPDLSFLTPPGVLPAARAFRRAVRGSMSGNRPKIEHHLG